MDDSRLIELLREADRANPAPMVSANLAEQVRFRLRWRRATRLAGAACAACIATLLVVVGQMLLMQRSSGGKQLESPADPFADASAGCVVDEAEIVQHVASLIGGRGVVVVWSYRGSVKTGPLQSMDVAGSKYEQRVLACQQSGEQCVVWSLFVPKAGMSVNPFMEPPMVRVQTSTGRQIALSALPKIGPREQVVDDLRSASLPGRPCVSLEDIEWMMQGT